MRVVINGTPIIGIERHIAKAIVESICDRCVHKTVSHLDTGCKIFECECRKGYTSFLLLQDEEFINEIVREGLF